MNDDTFDDREEDLEAMLKTTRYLRHPFLFTTRLWGKVGVHLHIGAQPFLPSHLNDLKCCFERRFGRAPTYAFPHSDIPWTTITLIDHLSESEERHLIRDIVVMLNTQSQVEWDHEFVIRHARECFTDSICDRQDYNTATHG